MLPELLILFVIFFGVLVVFPLVMVLIAGGKNDKDSCDLDRLLH